MWGSGGRHYWGRRDGKVEGIVVVFAWMSSKERHVKNSVEPLLVFGLEENSRLPF